MGQAPDKRGIHERLAHDIAKSLAHHPLLLADGLLDEARCFFMTSKMSGASDEIVIAQLRTPGEAVDLSARYIGLSLQDMLKIEVLVRLSLWCAHFATMPGTRFGAGLASAMEEAKRYANPPETSNGKPN